MPDTSMPVSNACPGRLRDLIATAPASPGVYLIKGEHTSMPLYIGKSINIRSRLMSHLRAPQSQRFIQQARDIEFRLTAGEISALLLESQLIKDMQPLYNKRLRRNRRLCSLRITETAVDIVNTAAPNAEQPLYGLFKSRQAALDALRQIADEYGLCLAAMGIEKSAGRPCFRFQLNKCRGACCGVESLPEHHARLAEALALHRLQHWPFPGAVAIHEQSGQLEAFHVINHWHLLGSFQSLEQARASSAQPPTEFDADSYKILVRPVLTAGAELIPLDN